MLLLHPCFNYTGCSRRATAAVARCIVFPDVLSFTEDSSAAPLEAGIPARNAPVFGGKYFRAGPPVLAGKRLRRGLHCV